MNATAEDRENARAVMLDRTAMTALVEAALSGTDLDACECIALCREEFNAGAPCVNVKTGAIEYATGVAKRGLFRSVVYGR